MANPLDKPFTNLSASSNGEIYDISDAKKFVEFGWRCSTNETGFKSETLIGNWNEERYDIKYLAKKKPLPSQVRSYIYFLYMIVKSMGGKGRG